MDQRIQFIADHFLTRCRSPSCARSTAFRVRPATSLSIAISARGPRGWRRARGARDARPMKTPAEIVKALLDPRRRHPRWVPRTPRPAGEAPAPGKTGPHHRCDILSRHGMVPSSAVGAQWSPRKPGSGSWRPMTSGARLQGAVPDRRWPLLLSADARRWLQPLPAGLPGSALDGARRGQADVHPPLPGVWAAAGIRSDNGVPFATTTSRACRSSPPGGSAWASCPS